MRRLLIVLLLVAPAASAHLTDTAESAIAAREACIGDITVVADHDKISTCIATVEACGSINEAGEFVNARGVFPVACLDDALTVRGVTRDATRVKRPLRR